MSGTFKIGMKLIEDLRNMAEIKDNPRITVLLNRAETDLREAEAYDNSGKYIDNLMETIK